MKKQIISVFLVVGVLVSANSFAGEKENEVLINYLLDEITKLKGEVDKLKSKPHIKFGDWVYSIYELNKFYKAETDGFVSAYTRTNNAPNSAEIKSAHDNKGTSEIICTKIQGRYDGSVCPVKKGHYWRVTVPESYKGNGVNIRWMPITD